MSEIKAEVVGNLVNSARRLALTTEPGTISVATKSGPVSAGFGIGEALIVDDKGASLVGPVSAGEARKLAAMLLDGDEQIATHPMALLFLATAVVAFVPEPPTGSRPSEPIATAMLAGGLN